MSEVMVAALAISVLIAGFLAWKLTYICLAYLVSKRVRADAKDGQFKVLLFSYDTDSLDTIYLSTTFPPHIKKKVVRAIRLWALVHNHYLIAISVNQPTGESIYKRYHHRLMF